METVLIVPALIMVVMLVVQAGVVMHGANVAHHVATQGAMAGARYGATTAQAQTAAGLAASALGSTMTGPAQVTVTGTQVLVRVSISVPRAVPFFAPHVSREVAVPRERFVVYDDR